MENTTTIGYLFESDNRFGMGLQAITENERQFETIKEASDEIKNLLGFTLEKVNVACNKSQNYYIEYANNIERYMEDQKIYTVEEAIENIENHYGILGEDVSIVIDESCVNKLDIDALSKKYNVIRK